MSNLKNYLNNFMIDKVDLHTHTTHSDGFYTPEELILKAKLLGIKAISITDHDSISAFSEASAIGKKTGVEVIPGVELSTDIGESEVHILGYLFDTKDKDLKGYLKFFREERYKRACRIIEKLNSLGFTLSIDEIKLANKNSAIGRPHIAKLLYDKGYVKTYIEAFNKFIGNGCPAHIKKVHLSPQSAFKIIKDAGGLSFIAHPGKMPETLLKDLIDAGVDGIEVIHPSHSPSKVNFYKGVVNSFYLLSSGGSDFHGGKREDDKNFGKYYVGYEILENLKKSQYRNTA